MGLDMHLEAEKTVSGETPAEIELLARITGVTGLDASSAGGTVTVTVAYWRNAYEIDDRLHRLATEDGTHDRGDLVGLVANCQGWMDLHANSDEPLQDPRYHDRDHYLEQFRDTVRQLAEILNRPELTNCDAFRYVASF